MFLRLFLHSLPKQLQVPRKKGQRDKVYIACRISADTNFAEGLWEEGFRTWHDSTGLHRQEAAFIDYRDGIVHLSSSDGALLEIHEGRLSADDLIYVQSLYKKLQRKVTWHLF
jgi:hypothetical protein